MSCKGVVLALPPFGGSLSGRDAAAGLKRIANRPIVCHVLEALRAAGTRELALAVPPEALEEISQVVREECDLDTDVTYLAPDGRRDLRGALAAIEPFVGGDPCIIHVADAVGQRLPPFSEVLDEDSPDIALFLHRGGESSEPLGASAARLLGVSDLDSSKSPLALAGVCYLGRGALQLAYSPAPSEPDDEPIDLVTIAERVASGGARLHVRRLRPWRRDGSPVDLLEMNRIVLDQLDADSEIFERNGNQIEGRVLIDPSADISSSVILGPVVIGAGSCISSAYIGPYTAVGREVTIEGAEIERSIVADGVEIMHIADRIEASTVGCGSRIFRDFSLPRGMRLHVGEGVHLALN